MSFERNENPYKSLRIGSGRARKMFWVSVGANEKMRDDMVLAMLRKWQHTEICPRGIWPLVEREDGAKCYVETSDLIGKLIEWNGNTYQLPE